MTDIAEQTPNLSDAMSETTRDFMALLKPRVMFLVVFTGFAGMVVAPGHINPVTGLIAIACIALASGAAGAINMWYDRDIDALMSRTQHRPIPAGRVAPEAALIFGVITTFAAISMMGLVVNWTAGLLLAGASFYYIFVYTIWLKRVTPQNIVIGGAAGAFPPLIGWTAVTGEFQMHSLILFVLIFLWTPPHFWALALYRSEDYRKARIPMLPVVSGARRTKIEMMVYTLLVAPVAILPYVYHMAGHWYLAAAIVLDALFILTAFRVLKAKPDDDHPAKQMFAFSILYLFLLFACLIADPIKLHQI
jgi:protoheme IX farnesyltransferase